MGTINIPPWEIKGGNYTLTGDETVNGPGFFAPGSFADAGNATINAAVLWGNFTAGSITDGGLDYNGGNMTFTNFVSPLATVNLLPNSTITLDHPHEFFATIGYEAPAQYDAPAGEYVDLVGLANADSYSLKNDLVTIYGSNGHPIDFLRVSSSIAASLQLPGSTTSLIEDAGSVYLTAGYGSYRIPGGLGAGTVLQPKTV